MSLAEVDELFSQFQPVDEGSDEESDEPVPAKKPCVLSFLPPSYLRFSLTSHVGLHRAKKAPAKKVVAAPTARKPPARSAAKKKTETIVMTDSDESEEEPVRKRKR